MKSGYRKSVKWLAAVTTAACLMLTTTAGATEYDPFAEESLVEQEPGGESYLDSSAGGSAVLSSFQPIDELVNHYKLGLERQEEDFPASITGFTADGTMVTVPVLGWECLDDYNENLGSYRFVPELAEGYSLESGAELPELTVRVEDESQGAVMEAFDTDLGFEVPMSVRSTSGRRAPAVLERKYDGFERGNMPNIRNQNPYGTCWAHAALGAMELDLIHDGEANPRQVDLSELHLAYFYTHQYEDPKECHNTIENEYGYNGAENTYLDTGGATGYLWLTNNVGAVDESTAPYYQAYDNQLTDSDALTHNVASINALYLYNPEDQGAIKAAIKEHGGVGASMYATAGSQAIYNADHNTFYGEVDATNHAILLVGWNDDIPSSYFGKDGCRPEGDGGWLVRNSWGLDDYGKNGYFWLSYYDHGFLSSEEIFAVDASTDCYQHVYSYDSSPLHAYYTIDSNEISFSTTYDVDAGELIEAVGTEVIDAGLDLTVTVEAEDQTSTGTLSTGVAGFYMIPLDDAITVSRNQTVTVTLNLYNRVENTVHLLVENSDSWDRGNGLFYNPVAKRGFDSQGYHYDDDPILRLYTNDTDIPVPDTAVVKLEDDEIGAKKGETIQLELTPDSTVNVGDVTWISNNTGIATVDENGLVTVTGGKGTTNIRGIYNGKTVSCAVTVKPFEVTYHVESDVVFVGDRNETYYADDSEKGLVSIPYRQGYKRLGMYWDAEKTKQVQYLNLYMQTGDLDLYPEWYEDYYTLSCFKPNDDLSGYSTESQILNYIRLRDMPYQLGFANQANQLVKNYNTAHGTNYELQYWSTDPEGEHPISSLTADEAFNLRLNDAGDDYIQDWAMTLYPQYAEPGTYTVTLNGNGGQVSPSRVLATQSGFSPALPTPTRTGYVFDGWYTAADGGSKIQSGDASSITAATTLYAHWIEKNYRVTYDLQGGTWDDAELTHDVAYGSTYPTFSSNPTKTGYTFAGWFTSEIGGTEIKSGDKFEQTADQTLYAHWTADTYQVTYDLQGGNWSVTTRTISLANGDKYPTYVDPTKTGYTFEGWFTAVTGGTEIEGGDTATLTAKQTLYAHWTKIPDPTYQVTYDPQGGNWSVTTRTISLANGDKYPTYVDPTKTGYTFEGWFTAVTGGSEIKGGDTATLTSNQTLYAHWTKIPDPTYQVTYDPQGGNWSVTTRTIRLSNGDKYPTYADPTKTGYTFEGWYTAVTGGTQIAAGTTVSLTKDITLYAHWTKIPDPKYQVTYDPQGGNWSVTTRTISLSNGDKYPTYVDPSKTGYTFEGWFTAVTGGTEIEGGDTATLTSNQTLYAHWTKVPDPMYQVTYNPQGGNWSVTTRTISLANGDKYPTYADPTKTGYTFEGWYTTVTGGTQIAAGTTVSLTKDITLYAHWKAVPASQEDSKNDEKPVSGLFADVSDSSKWYYAPVYWAVNQGITSGVDATHFGASNECTRAQAMTFLYKAKGSPQATPTNRFTDVPMGKWYSSPVAWAVDNGITSGTGGNTFGTNDQCTRAQIVTFLWKAAGSPTADKNSGFVDVPADKWYAAPITWAVEQGITSGIGNGMFGPGNKCTRAQIVTFLSKVFM